MLPYLLFVAQVINPSPTVEELTITGTRTPTDVRDLSSPVSILTAEDLQKRQIIRVVDALGQLPGVAIARGSSVGGGVRLRLRGGEANHVLVLIDGIEVNDPAAGDEFQFEHLTVTNIEKIELIRGPMSTAWGSDALAGVISITTKQGEGDPKVSFHGEGGSFDTYAVGGNISGGDDGWHYSAAVDWRDSGGVNASRLGEEDDGYENFTASLRTGYRFNDRLSFDLTARAEDTRTEFDGVDFVGTGLPTDTDNVSHTTKYSGALTVKGTIIDGLWSQTARVTYLDTELDNRANGAGDGLTAAEKWGFYTDTILTPYKDQTITLFFDHEDSDFSQRGTATIFGNPNQNQDLSVTGYGINYVGELLGGLTLNLSLREDDNSDFGNFTSWRAGLSAEIPPTGTRFFGGITRGQKAPTFIERFGFFPDQFTGNPDVNPEKSTQIEIGFEQQIGKNTNLSITAFFAELEDELNGFAFDPVTRLFTVANQEGTSNRDGIEVTIDSQLSEAVSISGQYSYVRAREEDQFGTRSDELRRPRHQASINGTWQATDRLAIALDATYRGHTDDLFFPPFPAASQRVRLDDYVLIRAATSYQVSEKLTFKLRAENLLDEDYEDIIGFGTPGIGIFAGLNLVF